MNRMRLFGPVPRAEAEVIADALLDDVEFMHSLQDYLRGELSWVGLLNDLDLAAEAIADRRKAAAKEEKRA